MDVPENSWYADAADFVAQRGLMSGVGENLFGGNQNTTRAMLMTILARMDGQDVSGGATWYEKGMNWAKNNGVSDGTMPEVNITREQLATMLYSYAKLKGVDTTQGGMAVREFDDFEQVSDYAGEAMTWAVNTGIDASSGLGYVQWIIMAIGLIFTLIMGISTGFAFKNDAANAKAQLIGTILIPVLFAIVLYIFNKTLGISLNASSGL